MKVIIAGSRSINDEKLIEMEMENIINYKHEIVCGMAKGVDLISRKIAIKHGLIVHEFPADWDSYGKSAGYKRNVQMADFADALLAFWDGESRGTQHMINIAKEKKLKIRIVYIKKEEVE